MAHPLIGQPGRLIMPDVRSGLIYMRVEGSVEGARIATATRALLGGCPPLMRAAAVDRGLLVVGGAGLLKSGHE